MVLSRGHNICFYGKIRIIIPKIFLLPPLIWNTMTPVRKSSNSDLGGAESGVPGRVKPSPDANNSFSRIPADA